MVTAMMIALALIDGICFVLFIIIVKKSQSNYFNPRASLWSLSLHMGLDEAQTVGFDQNYGHLEYSHCGVDRHNSGYGRQHRNDDSAILAGNDRQWRCEIYQFEFIEKDSQT